MISAAVIYQHRPRPPAPSPKERESSQQPIASPSWQSMEYHYIASSYFSTFGGCMESLYIKKPLNLKRLKPFNFYPKTPAVQSPMISNKHIPVPDDGFHYLSSKGQRSRSFHPIVQRLYRSRQNVLVVSATIVYSSPPSFHPIDATILFSWKVVLSFDDVG